MGSAHPGRADAPTAPAPARSTVLDGELPPELRPRAPDEAMTDARAPAGEGPLRGHDHEGGHE